MGSVETKKANILLFGGGAVGAIAALAIELGGLGIVSAVLRSNFKVVSEEGYVIESVDYGKLKKLEAHKSLTKRAVLNAVPDVTKEGLPPYNYILTITKNCPDIPPSLESLIAPAVTPGRTIIVMIQNGLNIEKAMFAAFPTNIVLSGVSMIDSHEGRPGEILHEEHDLLYIGAFHNPTLNKEKETTEAEKFIQIYNETGKSTVEFSEDVGFARWRKLIFNAALNPLCAILGLDDARIRLTGSAVEGLVRPAMKEIWNTARKLGYELPEDTIEKMIHCDSLDLYLKPSMQCDLEKGNYLEFENLVGEPLREAEKLGVETPILRMIYEMCRALRWRVKEQRGLISVPPKRRL